MIWLGYRLEDGPGSVGVTLGAKQVQQVTSYQCCETISDATTLQTLTYCNEWHFFNTKNYKLYFFECLLKNQRTGYKCF